LTISNPDLKAESSNASPGGTVHFFGCDDQGFLKEGVKTCLLSPISPLKPANFFFSVFTSIVSALITPPKVSKA
jgi:hypothetical protein